MNVAHTESIRPSTTPYALPTVEKPDTEELIASLRAEVDALHAFVRALVPLARPDEIGRACNVGESAIHAYADAMYDLRRLEAALGDADEEPADVEAAAE